jgi:hypothetical protein
LAGKANSSDMTTALAGKQASLGYTPVNKAGDTMTGVHNLNGLFTAAYNSGDHGNYNKTYKVFKINSFYWGSGGVIVEVFRRYHSDFGYAKYRIHGHGATYYGAGCNVTLLQENGAHAAIRASSINIVNPSSGTEGWGYYDILLDEGTYSSSVVKVTASLDIYPSGTTMATNRIVMYPDYTGV